MAPRRPSTPPKVREKLDDASLVELGDRHTLPMRGAPLKSVQELLGQLLDVKERLMIVWRTSKGDVLKFPLQPPLNRAA